MPLDKLQSCNRSSDWPVDEGDSSPQHWNCRLKLNLSRLLWILPIFRHLFTCDGVADHASECVVTLCPPLVQRCTVTTESRLLVFGWDGKLTKARLEFLAQHIHFNTEVWVAWHYKQSSTINPLPKEPFPHAVHFPSLIFSPSQFSFLFFLPFPFSPVLSSLSGTHPSSIPSVLCVLALRPEK